MAEKSRDERYQAYMEAIRRRVCGICLDQGDDGGCRLSGHRLCAVETHLPRVVDAILAVSSNRMDEYMDAIRGQVCGGCAGQEQDGHCRLRQAGDCALWAYLPLVVDAIEEVSGARREPERA